MMAEAVRDFSLAGRAHFAFRLCLSLYSLIAGIDGVGFQTQTASLFNHGRLEVQNIIMP